MRNPFKFFSEKNQPPKFGNAARARLAQGIIKEIPYKMQLVQD